jgi:hypothetical protein
MLTAWIFKADTPLVYYVLYVNIHFGNLQENVNYLTKSMTDDRMKPAEIFYENKRMDEYSSSLSINIKIK